MNDQLLEQLLEAVKRFIHDTGVKDWIGITESVTANFPIQDPKLFYHLNVYEQVKSIHEVHNNTELENIY